MSDLFHVNTASFGDITISSSVKAAIGADIDLSNAAQVTGKFTGDGSGLTNVTASNSELANTSSYSVFAETSSLATDLYFEDATHHSVPFFQDGRLYRDSIITACTESLSIGHNEEVSTWLALGPASTNKVSIHMERATAAPNVYTTPAGSLFIGPDCGMLRGIVGNGEYGVTGWYPITIFKQTAIVEISGSITGSQSISSGIPSMVLFAPDSLSPRQNFLFEFYGDSTFVGNNRDVVLSVLAMTWDLVTPMTSSVVFSTGTIRFNTMASQTWRFNGQINPQTTGSACQLLGHGQFMQFTATNTNTPFGLSSDVTIDNSKPIRLALVAGWVSGNTTADKIRCKNGYIQIQ